MEFVGTTSRIENNIAGACLVERLQMARATTVDLGESIPSSRGIIDALGLPEFSFRLYRQNCAVGTVGHCHLNAETPPISVTAVADYFDS